MLILVLIKIIFNYLKIKIKDVIDDRINRKEHFANEYFGNIRIQPVRRHSIRLSVVSLINYFKNY